MPQIVSQVQIKRSDKTLANLSSERLKYGEPILLTNPANKALVIGNSSENDALSNEYFIPLETKDTLDKGYMVKGVDYVTAGQKAETTLGSKATAEGNDTTASGTNSHAEGNNTIASSAQSHAEGSSTVASGTYSHAEGNTTTASGVSAHAEGDGTTASGSYSHSEGLGTVANHKSQHVFGEYNTLDASAETATNRGNYVEIVGNGSQSSSRSNARTLDWSGNEVLAGKLTVGSAPTANMDVTTKTYVDSADNTKQAKITASGILKGNGSGGVSAAVAGTDYQTPIANNITGSGTNGYIAKFNGSNTITNGPAFGSGGTFLRNDGQWATPANTTTGTTYAAASVPNNTTFGTNGSIYNVYNATKHSTLTVTLAAASWNAYNQQAVGAAGVTASNLVQVSPDPASWTAAAQAGIYCSAQGANSLTFTCLSKPAVAITMNVVIWS